MPSHLSRPLRTVTTVITLPSLSTANDEAPEEALYLSTMYHESSIIESATIQLPTAIVFFCLWRSKAVLFRDRHALPFALLAKPGAKQRSGKALQSLSLAKFRRDSYILHHLTSHTSLPHYPNMSL